MAKPDRSQQPTEALQVAWQSFDAGDMVAARRLAAAVALSPPSPEVEAEARDLMRRTDVAWPVLLFGGLAGLFMVGLILLTIVRNAHP